MIRVAAVQSHPRLGEVEQNVGGLSQLVRSTKADLYVLPELCTTGYAFPDKTAARSLAEPYPTGPSLYRLAELSRETGSVLVAGFAELGRDDKVYNSAALFDHGRPLACYRKIHLFDTEFTWSEPGDRPPRGVLSASLREPRPSRGYPPEPWTPKKEDGSWTEPDEEPLRV